MEENKNVESVQKEKKNYGIGIASLVLGILSVVSMCYIVISVILGVLAVIFGITSCIVEKKGMGTAGLIIGISSLFITIFLYVVLGVMQLDILMVPDWYKIY